MSAIYTQDPTPPVSCEHGAPMGRYSRPLTGTDVNQYRARVVRLDSGGYDKGGAYWGARPNGCLLFAVEDGEGNTAFIDAWNIGEAIRKGFDH